MSVTVKVPASTANLGSGYDAFGLALAMHNTVSAAFSAGGWGVSVTGEGADMVSLDAENRVASAMAHLFAEAGERGRSASITCDNGIPLGKGLGSSSAAIVGGLVAANELLSRPFSTDDIFRMAARLEGHPDNVAAALYGAFTICWQEEDGPRAARVAPPGGIAAVCVVSDAPLSTKAARALLPLEVPHGDAAFDAGRAGLLATGIALGRADLIGAGMNDRLHEPYRAAAVTDLTVVREALLQAGADGAALSGAGPTVIGLVAGADDAEALARAAEVASRAAELLTGHEGRRTPAVVALDRAGAVLIDK
ncbi:MAG: homoserine kinase [Coriobacteriia bacterium]|nr:homoserine kinase [Coriobacteriia bacterium]